jgi:preprotein translocase subunit SecG
MPILINLLLILEALVAVLMMLVILMQRPKSEGLGAAFGGGVTENIFGAQTTNVLTTATTWLASIFFIIVLALSVLYAHRGAPDSAVRRELMKTSAPAKAPAPIPAKAAAQNAATDAKTTLNPAQQGAGAPETGAAASPAGVAPAAAPAATPAASVQPTP